MPINKKNKKVAIIMGSQSDHLVMKKCEEILKELLIKFETKIISAHRTPDRMFEFAKTAVKNNFAVIVAGAGGSAHLPGMIASMSTLPVLGVPVETKKLKGLDSLLSIVQMPKGIPVGTLAIGENGAYNAGLLAASIMALSDSKVKKNLEKWRRLQTAAIKKKPNKNG
jgi:5-(carboxyamino)imidazole ribonucleotide mutase